MCLKKKSTFYNGYKVKKKCRFSYYVFLLFGQIINNNSIKITTQTLEYFEGIQILCIEYMNHCI